MVIRPEEERDRREAEELTREAFWNQYRPGCTEHFILHRFRDLPGFVPELCTVIEDEEGRLAAHILYSRAEIRADGGQALPVLLFGPVSVRPDVQRKGYGSAIIRATLEKAAALGYGAVAVTGDPNYYHRFGFVGGSSVGVYYAGFPRGEETPFFMVKELRPGFLAGVTGTFRDPEGYETDEAEVDAFDASFPPKEKKKLPGQLS